MRILLFTCLVFCACNRTPEIPKNVLPPQKMEKVMWDMLRADALLTNPSAADTVGNAYEKRIALYKQVMQLHGTTREELDRSLDFYEKRPDLLKAIFDSLQNKTEVLPQQRQIDSLRSKRILPHKK